MILNFLLSYNINNLKIEEFYDCLTYLELFGVDKKLIECFESIIINNCENKNPVNYLDSITEKQFIKIRNKVL